VPVTQAAVATLLLLLLLLLLFGLHPRVLYKAEITRRRVGVTVDAAAAASTRSPVA